jgi:hypothetical protein
VHPTFKMGGYTLVETRFNLYKLDICPATAYL